MKLTYVNSSKYSNVKEVLKAKFSMSDRLLLKVKKLDKIYLNGDVTSVNHPVLENDLIEFKKYLIIPENYTFYDTFCEQMKKDINFKKNQIIKYGTVIDIPKNYGAYLPMETSVKKMSKIQEIITTIKDFIFGE